MTEPTTSIANVGDLAKPATTLIEKISEALGGAFRPSQIRRVAKADADASVIRAKAQAEVEAIRAAAQVEVTGVHLRGIERFVAEEGRKQRIIEEIITKALPHVDEAADPSMIESDWLAHFFDRCRLISNHQMQEVWSRLLAGEANEPGAYSKRTVNLLATLDKGDAEMFTALCRFTARTDAGMVPLILNPYDSYYHDAGVNVDTLAHLADIGLIRFDPHSGWSMTAAQPILFEYFDAFIHVETNSDPPADISVGHSVMTQAGSELATICGPEPIADFPEYLGAAWESQLGVILRVGNLRDMPESDG